MPTKAALHCDIALRMAREADVDNVEKARMLGDVAGGLQQQAQSLEDLDAAATLLEAALALDNLDPALTASLQVQLAGVLAQRPDEEPQTLERARSLLELAENAADHPEERADIALQLGLVLQSLAGLGRADPRQAITRYHEALRYFTAGAHPATFAVIHNNLATLWLSLASPDSGGAHEALAVQSFTTALRELDPRQHPNEYAMLQNNLGNALQYADSSHALENNLRALDAYDEALRIRRHGPPALLANTLANRANCLTNLPRDLRPPQLQGREPQHQAIDDARAALDLFLGVGDNDKAEAVKALLDELSQSEEVAYVR